MKDKLIIIGTGGHGKVVADIAIKNKIRKRIYFFKKNIQLPVLICFIVIITGPSIKRNKLVIIKDVIKDMKIARNLSKATFRLKKNNYKLSISINDMSSYLRWCCL